MKLIVKKYRKKSTHFIMGRHIIIYIENADNEVLSWGMINKYSKIFYNLRTLPEYRNKGLATQIINKAFELYPDLKLDCRFELIPFYKTFNLKIIDKKERYVTMAKD